MRPGLARVLRAVGGEPVLDALVGLSGSRLRTLLLELHTRRAHDRPLRDILAQAGRTPVVAPDPLGGRALHALEARVWRALDPGIEDVVLGPVVPAASHHVLAGTPQDNVLSATRDLEVTGDPTVALCLLAARRRAHDPATVRLATIARPVRMQPLASPLHTQHFHLLAQVTAGRAEPNGAFVGRALLEHVSGYLRIVCGMQDDGYRITGVRVAFSDTTAVRTLARDAGVDLESQHWTRSAPLLESAGVPRFATEPSFAPAGPGRASLERLTPVADAIHRAFPGVEVGFDGGRTRQALYFDGPMFHVLVGTPDGTWTAVVDGGTVDWTARLLQNRSERALTSGAGLSLLHRLLSPVA